jgi:hypothetical protein
MQTSGADEEVTMIGVGILERWLSSRPRSREEPFVKLDILIDRRTNRETQELSKRFEVPNTRLDQGLIQTALDVLHVAPREIAPIKLTSELYRPEVALAVFRRSDPDGVDDAKREILEAMELASIMG